MLIELLIDHRGQCVIKQSTLKVQCVLKTQRNGPRRDPSGIVVGQCGSHRWPSVGEAAL